MEDIEGGDKTGRDIAKERGFDGKILTMQEAGEKDKTGMSAHFYELDSDLGSSLLWDMPVTDFEEHCVPYEKGVELPCQPGCRMGRGHSHGKVVGVCLFENFGGDLPDESERGVYGNGYVWIKSEDGKIGKRYLISGVFNGGSMYFCEDPLKEKGEKRTAK